MSLEGDPQIFMANVQDLLDIGVDCRKFGGEGRVSYEKRIEGKKVISIAPCFETPLKNFGQQLKRNE